MSSTAQPAVVVDKSEQPAPAAADIVAPELPLPGEKIAVPIEIVKEGPVVTEKEISLETGKEIPASLADNDVTALPPISLNEEAEPHIALLLPLKSKIFNPAAEAVLQGFQAAADLGAYGRAEGALPVRVYPCFDEDSDIVALYRQAIADGARAVVGPLTRSGVGILAAEPNIPVPTLALNVTENSHVGQLYFFGMAMEAEARQVAQLVKQDGFNKVIIITSQAQLARRLQLAFEEKWQGLGGAVLREIEFTGDPAILSNIEIAPDTAAFLAVDAEKARLIRPFMPNKFPMYATSQVFVGNDDVLTNFDLSSVRFVDMPWLLQIDHPAVMIYPRAAPPLQAGLERLYALGIDAFRLTQLLLSGKVDEALPLDGVSGQIQLRGHTFQRVAVPAVFAQGHAQLANTPAVPATQPFPESPQPASHE